MHDDSIKTLNLIMQTTVSKFQSYHLIFSLLTTKILPDFHNQMLQIVNSSKALEEHTQPKKKDALVSIAEVWDIK